MSGKLEFDAYGEITNVNLRVEKHGGEDDAERVAACDIDLYVVVDAEIVNTLATATAAFQHVLFDDDQQPKALNLKPLAFDCEFEQLEISLEYSTVGRRHEIKVPARRVRKFKATPQANREIKLSFQVQCIGTEQISKYITAWVKQSVQVKVKQPKQVDAFEDETPPPPPPGSPEAFEQSLSQH